MEIKINEEEKTVTFVNATMDELAKALMNNFPEDEFVDFKIIWEDTNDK